MHSLIVPVYRNEASVPELLDTIDAMNVALDGQLEAVFVVDGSPDRSGDLLCSALPRRGFASRVVFLSRNFGSFAAIRVGLEHAAGRYFAVMAADLQEPAELALGFFQELSTGTCDVVVGTRQSRSDPLLTRVASALFWRLYRRYVLPAMPPGGVDVFGCNSAFRKQLLACEESNTSLVALLFWLGFRRHEVPYRRRRRATGRSRWTLRRRVTYVADSVFSFTDLPVRLLIWVGVVGMVLSTIAALIVLVVRLVGEVPVPGYAATVLMVLFFGGLNALGLGVVGSYAWRAYENTKRRPNAVVSREIEFPATQDRP
jgi:glycosyltransferase involved in cell wall biosynthesis